MGRILRDAAEHIYKERTGRKKKIIYKQIGYETLQRAAHQFRRGPGQHARFRAYKLYQNSQFDCMGSVSDNFQIVGVPFSELVDSRTLLTRLRNVPRGSDFFELKEALSQAK